MILLLIIADDFTGALDTGVQFAARGVRTRVVVGPKVNFAAAQAEVLVVNTETRHLTTRQAYDTVAQLTAQADRAGVPYIYKKTDSALRGNIGAELTALLRASGRRQLPFLPAFPQTGRVTVDGVHLVDGVPVTESPFGADPFEPVQHSVVTELIAEQSDVPAHSFPALTYGDPVPEEEGILVFDADSPADLLSTGRQLLNHDGLHIMAGCAGFGAVLPELLGIAADAPRQTPELDPRLLVVCGSVNPITVIQLKAAEKAGFTHIHLTPEQKLEPGHWQSPQARAEFQDIYRRLEENPLCIIDANDMEANALTEAYASARGIQTEDVRLRVARSIGHLVGILFTSSALGTLLITGGDTLLQCMECVDVRELEPVCELEEGVVLSRFTYKGRCRYVISKSGGFGRETLLIDLARKISRTTKQGLKNF
ncbi:Four-carbon acid sugar kinase family protein [Ruminococcaceae bacterium BL-6]|nr:Four-carbon acid sugar kinase family protein [Ruminococcaceae bacterium BL-6]